MSTAKNYSPVSLLSIVSKIFEKLVNNKLIDHFSMVSGILDQLQTF